MVWTNIATSVGGASARRKGHRLVWLLLAALVASFGLSVRPTLGQQPVGDWQADVQKHADAHDWDGALRIVDREIARSPEDADILAWRARVLQWAGRTAEAERAYSDVVRKAPKDPDNWLGLGTVYVREGRTEDALHAMDRAIELDPKRADLRMARARVLRTMGDPKQARLEFQRALALDPASAEARAELSAMRGGTKHELRIGADNDLFNFTTANHDQLASLVSRWSPHWTTSEAGNFYQTAGTPAGKFVGSVTGTAPHWGSLTVGGAVGHDNGVIPESEAFFEADHGWKVSETAPVRGVELVYGQHWYWYTTARILSLTQTGIVYLPHDWTWSLGILEARSRFPGAPADWKPSGVTKLGFPVAHWGEKSLSGNVNFSVGTEDFGQVNQIGRFSSQTYGGGFRFQLTACQDVTGFAAYQRRTQDRTDTGFGFSYGFRF